MSTRKPTATADSSTHGAGSPPWSDLPRQQLAATAQACCAVFRGFEAIRRVQQKTAHQALAHHQAIAGKLKEPCQPLDLLALQAEMVRFDLQGATTYWQQVASAVLEMQRELVGGAASAAQSEAQQLSGGTPGSLATLNPFAFTVNGGQHAATA